MTSPKVKKGQIWIYNETHILIVLERHEEYDRDPDEEPPVNKVGPFVGHSEAQYWKCIEPSHQGIGSWYWPDEGYWRQLA
jgi:hypothetical protein